ncbi:MAG: hypothetical protein H6686_06390 [Fibrobacteria bacterium]|nr:hypothetical protein [Fibrobacteria bacterium]
MLPRVLFLLTLMLFVSCKQKEPAPVHPVGSWISDPEPDVRTEQAPDTVGSSPNLSENQPGPDLPRSHPAISIEEPDDFLPEFGLVLFGNCILLDTNGLAYPIKGDAAFLTREIAVADPYEDDLPSKWKDLVGKTFSIYSSRGEEKEEVVRSVKVVSVAEDGASIFDEIWDAHPDRRLPASEFRDLTTAHLLVAVFDDFSSSLRVPDFINRPIQWARLSSLDLPTFPEAQPQDPDFESRAMDFVLHSGEYADIQSSYEEYKGDPGNLQYLQTPLPDSWVDYATKHMTTRSVGGKDVFFLSLKSRANCADPNFTGEMNFLSWNDSIRFADLENLSPTDFGQVQLVFAWDNDSKGNLDLLFSLESNAFTFVRIHPDGTTRSFSLNIPYIGPEC